VSFNFLTRFLGKIFPAVVVECYVCAFTRKNLANCSTDSSRSAANERALSFKQAHQRFFS
jgi:hypothetical protein